MWSKPQFLFANATPPDPKKNGWFNHNTSYLDAVIDNGKSAFVLPTFVESSRTPDDPRARSQPATDGTATAVISDCRGSSDLCQEKPKPYSAKKRELKSTIMPGLTTLVDFRSSPRCQ